MNLNKWRIRVETIGIGHQSACWYWLIPPHETSVGYCCMTLRAAVSMALFRQHAFAPSGPPYPLPASVRERTERDTAPRERIHIVDGAVVVL